MTAYPFEISENWGQKGLSTSLQLHIKDHESEWFWAF
jgi:hypothetical protein